MLVSIYFPTQYFSCQSIYIEFIFSVIVENFSFVDNSAVFLIQFNSDNIASFSFWNSRDSYFFGFFLSDIVSFIYFCFIGWTVSNSSFSCICIRKSAYI